MKKDIISVLLTNISTAQFFAYVLIAMATSGVMLLFRVSTRDPLRPSSPIPFSWSYLWGDNSRRILGTFILILILVIVGQYYIDAHWMLFSCFGIGAISDQLPAIMRKFGKRLGGNVSNRIDSYSGGPAAPKDQELSNK
jgi:hypothetical protein